MSNIPFFFYDLGAAVSLPAGKWAIRPELYWNAKYIHQFYLRTIAASKEPAWFWQEAGVAADDVVPSQWSHDLGLGVPVLEGRWGMGLEIRNVLDAPLHDNLGLQKPGRSFHAKISARL